jgi:ATP-dependent DNA ligase
MPKFEFCIPTPGKAGPAGPEWFNEIKYDGYRLRVEREGNSVRLITKLIDGGLCKTGYQRKSDACP